jgi:hypothetical protein
MRDDGTRRRVWYKKGNLAIYEDGENVFGTLTTPDNIDDTLDYVEEKGFVRVPVSDLLYSDLSYLETRADSGILVGESRVEGVVCNHLAFRNEVVDWQLWIEKGSKPLFRKFLITYNEQPGQPQFAAVLDRWNFSPKLPDSLFLFSPPEGAEKIRFLSMQARPPDEEESGQSRTPSSEGEDTE